MLLFVSFFIFLCYGTSLGLNIVASVVTQLIVDFGPVMVIYNQDLKFALIFSKLINSMWIFVLLTIYGMTLTYIVQIKSQLVDLIQEKIQLFDKLHEGVVIVEEDSK